MDWENDERGRRGERARWLEMFKAGVWRRLTEKRDNVRMKEAWGSVISRPESKSLFCVRQSQQLTVEKKKPKQRNYSNLWRRDTGTRTINYTICDLCLLTSTTSRAIRPPASGGHKSQKPNVSVYWVF